MIRNDFIRKLAQLEPEIIKAKNLVVMAPASPDQRTWVSEGWRETVFGHFVAEGLSRQLSPSARPRVDSRSLFQHVSSRVKAWTRGHRGEEQTPILLPAGEVAPTLDLARASKPIDPKDDEPESVPIPMAWEARWRKCWQAYRDLKATAPEAYAPALWNDYRDWLFRHEALVRSLPPPDSAAAGLSGEVLGKVENTLDKLADRIDKARRIGLSGSLDASLAMRAAQGDPPGETKIEFDKLWDRKLADQVKITDRNRPAYYEALIRRLEPASGPDDFARARELLAMLGEGNRPRPIEAHFLAILLQDMPAGAAESPAYRELVGIALRVRRLAERVGLGLGREDSPGVAYAGEVAPLIEGRVAGADRDRRKAEDLLFDDDPVRWDEAKLGLLAAEKTLGDAQAEAAKWKAALEARNRAFADLPYLGAWAARGPADDPLVVALETAWGQAHDVTASLAPVTGIGAARGANRPIPDLPDPLAIEKRFQDECRKMGLAEAKPEDYEPLLGLLELAVPR